MTVQPIGKGQYRIKILSQARLARIRTLPNVTVLPDGRVIFRQGSLKSVLREATR